MNRTIESKTKPKTIPKTIPKTKTNKIVLKITTILLSIPHLNKKEIYIILINQSTIQNYIILINQSTIQNQPLGFLSYPL
jgi:hypothetical protein